LSILPIHNLLDSKGYQRLLKWLFLLVNTLILLVNFIDIKFFEFEQKRLTTDIFNKAWLGNDTLTLLPQFIKDFWYLILLFIGFAGAMIYWYPSFKKKYYVEVGKISQFLWQSIIAIVVMTGFVLGARGTLGLKPIRIISAAQYTAPENISIILNSSFTLIKTINKNELKIPEYYMQEQLDSVYSPVHCYASNQPFQPKNVVIFILESFGREYSGLLNSGVGYMPNLDSIMQCGLTFRNGFANGKRSIDAVPSLLSGIPEIMESAFVTSSYSGNPIESIGDLLKKKGYHTAFYHGGKNGTMGFDTFVTLAGIEKYYGLNEYPDADRDFDGNWGIYDEPYLQYFCKELTQTPKPFFATVFTLSSHHPYSIPEKYAGKFPKGNLVNLESIGYADFALGEFFRTASKQPWFKNTLFVFSADHTAQSELAFYKTDVGKYAIPICFYSPGDTLLTGFSDEICQQTDVFPSIMDYLHYKEPFVAFGSSVFDSTEKKFAITYSNGLYQLIYRDTAYTFNGKRILAESKINYNSVEPIAIADDSVINSGKPVNLMKAIIQQYNTRMITNQLKAISNYKSANQFSEH